MAEADAGLHEPAFLAGVHHARRSGSLLDAAFSARTLSLFDRLPPGDGPSYLSGLVIGEELRAARPQGRVIVVGNPALTVRYESALRHAGCEPVAAGERCTWHGLARLARHMEAT
jgi:2-dehydro-3-deoxygalactonokinase